MRETALFATLTALPLEGEARARLPEAVQGLEIRADLVGAPDPAALRSAFGGRLLYSLRSRAEGGASDAPARERRRQLCSAAERFDLVELEAERDLSPGILAWVPPEQRVLSWRGPARGLPDLMERFASMARVDARYYLLAPAASSFADALTPLRLLRGLRRDDVIAFATGPLGMWSRVLSAWMGAPVVFGGMQPGGSDGGLDVGALIRDYGLPALPPVRELFGIVGKAAGRSLSPRLHNAAYRVLGLPALYLPFQAECFRKFWSEELLSGLDELGTPLRGLTVTSPHKETALAVAPSASALALRSGAANALLFQDGVWRAETSDAEGVLAPLSARGIALRDRRVAIIGCGGAGRAAAVGLKQAGADVTLVNRGRDRGEFASRLLGLPFVMLSDFSPRGYSLVVNATPCAGHDGAHPFPVHELDDDAMVLDFAYGSRPTPTVVATAARGQVTIDGREVLKVEVRRQFQLMTGLPMPAAPLLSLLAEEGTPASERPRCGQDLSLVPEGAAVIQ